MDFAWEKVQEKGKNIYLYNGACNPSFTIKEICDIFYQIAGFQKIIFIVPLKLMKMVSIPFLVLNKIGIWKNSICPERIDKLVKSTNIVPQKLLDDNYEYKDSMEGSLLDWKKTNGFDGAIAVPLTTKV